MSSFKDQTGKRFGRLVVVDRLFKDGDKRTYWNCVCDCGNKTSARQDHLKKGSKYSCGCAQIDFAHTMNRKHGLYKHPLYKVWQSMISRCYWIGHKAFSYYGGRGIGVIDLWRNEPKAFIDWCIANGWEKGKEIDRIDTNLGYSPENIRLVDHKENMNNTRRCIYVTVNNMKMTLKQASMLDGAVSYSCLRRRVSYGWSGDIAVFGKGNFHRVEKSKYATADLMGFAHASE